MTDPTNNGEPDGQTTDPELASLKRELQEVKTDLNEIRADQEQTADALVNTFGMPRRSALRLAAGGISVAALTALASSPAMAAASTSDGDGDVGTPANPVDVFADGVDANGVSVATALSNSVATTNEIVPQAVTVANGATAELVPNVSGAKLGVLIVVVQSFAVSAMFSLRGGINAVSEIADPESNFGTSAASGNNFDVYHDGSNYVLDNQQGGSHDFQIWYLG